jgi:hypothetical protein
MDQRRSEEVDRRLKELRSDPEFQARLRRAIDENREALELLAKGDEEQADL